jgi:hypothetical protein
VVPIELAMLLANGATSVLSIRCSAEVWGVPVAVKLPHIDCSTHTHSGVAPLSWAETYTSVLKLIDHHFAPGGETVPA